MTEGTGLSVPMRSSATQTTSRGTWLRMTGRPKLWQGSGLLVAIILAFTVVPTLSPFYVSSAGTMAAYALVAMGASVIIQHANLPSIGHGAFFGIASYVIGLLLIHEVVTGAVSALALALLATAAVTALMGAVVLRTRAAYFMMITLAIGQLLSSIARSLTDVTGGDNGLTGIPLVMIGGIDLIDPVHFYYVCLTVLIVVSAFVLLLIASPYGYALRALKHDDRRARSLSVAPLRVKMIALVISGVITGLGGALYTLNVGYTDPTVLSANASGTIFLMVVLASRFGVLGPIVGAVVVEFITLIVGTWTTHSHLVLGVVSALVALFVMRPDGAPGRAKRRRKPSPAIGVNND